MAKYLLTGAFLGAAGVLLSFLGNPADTGLCVSCFLQNSAGALGFHANERMQYLRPELLGFVLGAAAIARLRGELKPTAGTAPLLRFAVGNLLIVGCAVFMGCPLKLFLRLGAGDLTALFGLAGLAAGVFAGIQFVFGGFRTGRARPAPAANGWLVPGAALALLALAFLRPSFLAQSTKGAGAEHAPMLLSLGVGLVAGALAQPTKFCITAGIARLFLWGGRQLPGCPKSAGLLAGIGAMLVAAVVASLATGQFTFDAAAHAGANGDYGWAFLGMGLVGLGSVLIRGCPFRQLVQSAQGDGDAGAAVLGMMSGAALVENWRLGSNALETPYPAKMAVLLGLALLVALALAYRDREAGAALEES